MTNRILFHEVCALITKHRGMIKKGISLSTTLRDDLGMEGDDAAEFIDEYFIQFNIDALNFRFQDYFGDEGFNLLDLFSVFKKSTYRPITVEHLVRCAENGKWYVPEG